MAQADKFKFLRGLARDLKSVIINLDDREKVYAIIDRFIQDKNDVDYGDNEYRHEYSDEEVYAIIEHCGFGEHHIDVFARLGRLIPEDLDTIRWVIGSLKLGK